MAMMDKFDIQFVTEMFLDTDSTTTINRIVLAIANVVTENCENVDMATEVMTKEHSQIMKNIVSPLDSKVARKRRKVFYEETVSQLTDDEYFETFNMRRNTVQALINLLKEFVKPCPAIVAFDKKVHVFLWVLTSGSSYGETGALFGLHKSSVSYIFHEIAAILADQQYNFITWPSVEEQHLTRIKVNSHFKFPNCVGFIDVSNFKVGSKRNKKKQAEVIVLQAVCDENLTFIDIHIGDLGIHCKKSKLFKESQLGTELKNFVDIDNHILGDTEYKLKKNLITPFSSEEVLTDEEMKFNETHWKARSYISHAFELLKERFRKLNHIDSSKPEAVKTLLCAACVLHNFILLHEGNPRMKEEPVTCDDAITIDPDIVKTAEEKRQFLCNYINYIDAT